MANRSVPDYPAADETGHVALLSEPMGQDWPLLTTKQQFQISSMVELGQTQECDRSRPAFLSRALILCSLPYRKTWDRQVVQEARIPGGILTLTLNALEESLPLPYGNDSYVLDLMTSQARYRKNPEISTEHLSELMAMLGSEFDGGKDYKIFMSRIKRIAALGIRVKRKGVVAVNARVVSNDGSEWWSRYDIRRTSKGERSLLPPVLRLSEEYFEDIMNAYVPIPPEVLYTFAGSPTEYSLAKWLWDRAIISETATVPPWDELLKERGSKDSNVWRFRGQVKRVIKKMAPAKPEIEKIFQIKPEGLAITPMDSFVKTLK